MTNVNRTLTPTQRKKVIDLARQGCSLVEVATALGYKQAEAVEIFEDEEHPFNILYWETKIAYTLRLRAIAMNIAESKDVDPSVRTKMLEFLAKENTEAFEKKQMHTGFTNGCRSCQADECVRAAGASRR